MRLALTSISTRQGAISCPNRPMSTLSRILWLSRGVESDAERKCLCFVCCKIYCNSFWLKSFQLRLAGVCVCVCGGNSWNISAVEWKLFVVRVAGWEMYFLNISRILSPNGEKFESICISRACLPFDLLWFCGGSKAPTTSLVTKYRWLFILSCLVYALFPRQKETCLHKWNGTLMPFCRTPCKKQLNE